MRLSLPEFFGGFASMQRKWASTRRWVGALLSAVVFVMGGEAFAATIWTTHGDGTRIGTIDSTSGVGTDTGATGQIDTFAAAFDLDGTLYTTYNGFSDFPSTSPGGPRGASCRGTSGPRGGRGRSCDWSPRRSPR